MATLKNDPIGQAILDYAATGIDKEIIVASDICEDDVISSAYLFRSYEEMPELEKQALEQCKGRVLEIGAGAGVHAKILHNSGKEVHCIDTSSGAVQYMLSQGISAEHIDFFALEEGKYDTLLLLMNGIGIAGSLSRLGATLQKAKTLLNKNGKLIFDSTDVRYLFEDDEGGMWVDLANEYYGNFQFQMRYGEHTSEWFPWLYIDFDRLVEIATQNGFKVRKLASDNQNQYLVELQNIHNEL